MHRFTKKGLFAAFGVVAVVVIGGLALAYWTGGGSGTGTSTAGTSGTVVLTGTSPAGIAPGTSAAVTFTAANSGAAAVYVTTVHMVSLAADAGHSACTTADFSMADTTQNHQVPAGATVEALPVTGSLVYANTGISQDACKGATLTLTLTSS
ncbi:MAG: hypothetical protein QOD60_1070 [Solirubrobacterales bacterium]|jgi:hypothetical protein|nr:hypothetical protein [Solirubrobacterales bacterium]